MINQYQSQAQEVIKHLQQETSKLRTSRATSNLVEDIPIEAYDGSTMKLKELASISIPQPRTIVIKPWDKNIIKQIEKGLINCHLEFNPVLESDLLRIQLPKLTQETREKLVKKLNQIIEQAKIKLRQIRDEVKKEIENQEKNSQITEDDKYRKIEKLNKETKKFNEKIEQIHKNKKSEIMTV